MPATMASKQSAVPASAPTSPLLTRAPKTSSGNALPVTPIRPHRATVVAAATMPRVTSAQHAHSMSGLRAPLTPASDVSSPHTPGLSNLSLTSADTSVVITPSKDGAATSRAAQLAGSPDLVSKKKLPSTADEADNWRSRASQNGIKVSSSAEAHFADDEDSENAYHSPTKSSTRSFNLDTAPLPAPFLSTHRRTRSSAQAQNQSAKTAMRAPSTPDRRSLSTLATLNTPPPKANILDKLKAKGIATEPPRPRRRASHGPAPTELFDIDEDDYNPYPHSFTGIQPTTRAASFHDPFNVSLSSIAESALPINDDGGIDLLPVDFESHELPMSRSAGIISRGTSTHCSVCDVPATRIAVLDPCGHPLCSACLTSALNIVGEKDMQCAVCAAGVNDFKLQTIDPADMPDMIPATSTPPLGRKERTPLLPSVFETAAGEVNPFVFFEQPQGVSTPPTRGTRQGENIVLRIDNVPWDITPPAIATWLRQPVELVHVLLDRKGKTLSHAYVEIANDEIAKAALRGAQNAILGKGKRARGVTVTRSSQEELMRALFPSWQGSFDGSRPSLNGLTNERMISTLEAGLVTEAELNALLHLIRSPDSHFLKVPALPFHSLVSILAKFPGDPDSRVCWSTTLRDNLFDVTSAAIQVMLPRVKENQTQETLELLQRLLTVAMSCQAFTPEQIAHIVELARHAPGQLQQNGHPHPQVAHFTPIPALPLQVPQFQSLSRGLPPQMSLPMAPPPGLNIGMRIPSGNAPSAAMQQPYRPTHLPYLPTQMPLAQPYVSVPMHAMYPPPPSMPQRLPGQVAPSPLDALAREFGVDASLIEALAHRLSGMR